MTPWGIRFDDGGRRKEEETRERTERERRGRETGPILPAEPVRWIEIQHHVSMIRKERKYRGKGRRERGGLSNNKAIGARLA